METTRVIVVANDLTTEFTVSQWSVDSAGSLLLNFPDGHFTLIAPGAWVSCTSVDKQGDEHDTESSPSKDEARAIPAGTVMPVADSEDKTYNIDADRWFTPMEQVAWQDKQEILRLRRKVEKAEAEEQSRQPRLKKEVFHLVETVDRLGIVVVGFMLRIDGGISFYETEDGQKHVASFAAGQWKSVRSFDTMDALQAEVRATKDAKARNQLEFSRTHAKRPTGKGDAFGAPLVETFQ
jgi:hypothetical protein